MPKSKPIWLKLEQSMLNTRPSSLKRESKCWKENQQQLKSELTTFASKLKMLMPSLLTSKGEELRQRKVSKIMRSRC